MLDRRRFLTVTGSAIAASALAPRTLRALAADHIDRIGLELYTVRSEMQKNVDATLARVAQIGYREVEFAGHFNRTPAQIRAALDANGLDAPSMHLGMAEVRSPDWPRWLEGARTMGHRYVIVAGLEEQDGASQDGYRRVADELVVASPKAAEYGITLGFHNHEVDFKSLDGKMGYEVLLERTAGSTVVFEMDLYWIIKAGQDPLAWFARFPGRFPLVHVKDSAGPPKNEMRDVGAGTIDWRAIFRHHEQAGIKYYFVEHDEPPDPFASATASFAYLSHLTF